MSINIGDLLYDGQILGMIVEGSNNDYIIEWFGDGSGRVLDDYIKFQMCSNYKLLLKWQASARALPRVL